MGDGLAFADMFCGIGGIRLGMERAGFRCAASCDSDPACRRAYKENFGEEPMGDIRGISAGELPGFDVLCAGFPCQPFSIAGRQKGFSDERGTLFFEICRILEGKRPRAVLLENVKQLVYHDGGRTFGTIARALGGLGYSVSWRVLDASGFSVPQHRERVIIIGMLEGDPGLGGISPGPRPALSGFLDREGDFAFLDEGEYTLLADMKEQPSGLVFAGYRNGTLRKAGTRPGTERLSRSHRQPDRIYSAKGVHPALSSQETAGRYLVLTEDGRVRRLTLSECWRIMGFPEGFRKTGPASAQYAQLGNSVCVPMIGAVAEGLARGLARGA